MDDVLDEERFLVRMQIRDRRTVRKTVCRVVRKAGSHFRGLALSLGDSLVLFSG